MFLEARLRPRDSVYIKRRIHSYGLPLSTRYNVPLFIRLQSHPLGIHQISVIGIYQISNFGAIWLAFVTQIILGYILLLVGSQNGASFCDSLRRRNLSDKWGNCCKKATKFGLSVFTARKNYFVTEFANI